ncbi:MAG: ABC transporter permease [Ruminococcaceae bacterium]|nr:ABC transporter permease [Oscillospiraceae bacterium]
MMTLRTLIGRNTRLFFKDKGMFFTALITPMILLVLYATFLGNVFRDAFLSGLPEDIILPEKLVGGFVGGQLISSILAVSCVTVAFCSNLLVVQDKANGTIHDLTVSPVSPTTLALSYYISTFVTTLLICLAAALLCFIYVGFIGWYLSAADVLLLLLDVVLMSLFGTAFSSAVNFFLSSQGQMSAVGSIVSSCYGFICGAYMPISQFSEGLQRVIMFLPGTYGTSLFRNHALGGVFREMEALHLPAECIDGVKRSIDASIFFFEREVSLGTMYLVITGVTLLLIGIYIALHTRRYKKTSK